MYTYATLNGVVVLVDPTQEQLDELVFLEDYDTVITLEQELTVGDNLPEPEPVTPGQLTMSKFQAFYALASFGLLDKADTKARRDGSTKLYEVWVNEANKLEGPWTVRKCHETVELIGLLGISSAQMDAVFERGSQMDINNPKEGLSEVELELFNLETTIWDRKRLLIETDYVEMPSYDKPKDGLLSQRATWRQEIRDAQAQIEAALSEG